MRSCAALATFGLIVLAGCSDGAINGSSGAGSQLTESMTGASLTGVVHGGQQPVVGAHVYLLAANTTGYGGTGLAASSSNASVSLLVGGSGTSLDTSGGATNGYYYVTTDSNGDFNISGDYACTIGTQVYLYALGGNSTYPNGSANSAIGLLAAIGTCPIAGSFPSSTFIVVNEVSTIATSYAFAGFATDAVHVSSSGTILAQTGIANAFANVNNLESLLTGAALATNPAGNGKVPQSTVNTLANILAACVNTTGPTSAGCGRLFANAMSAGSTGTTATDTATAAVNIAHNPGADIAALYTLSTATPPFAPTLTARPNDFTVAIQFTGGGLNYPLDVAIDASGDVWTTEAGANSISKFSSTGVALSPSTGYTGGLGGPIGIAIDNLGNAWIANEATANSSLSKFSRSLSVIAILAAWRPRQRGSGFVCGYVGMVFDSLSFSVAIV